MSTFLEGPAQLPKGKFATLIHAVVESWVYAISGIAVGFGCVWMAEHLTPEVGKKPILVLLLEHVGMGFIVAALAILFYEWGAHIKDSIRLGNALRSIHDAVASNALDKILHANVKGGESAETNAELVTAVEAFVTHVRELNAYGDWAKYAYVSYLSHVLRAATDNAQRLCDLSIGLRQNPKAAVAYSVVVLSPGAITDRLLAEQMHRLPSGGSYIVASNPRSWRNAQLSELHKESEVAVHERGVTIRRIFVLGHEGRHGPGNPTVDSRAVVEQHFKDATDWTSKCGGSYQIRLLDSDTHSKMTGNAFEAANLIANDHFAIFKAPKETHCIRIDVNEPDLSDLKISGVASDAAQIKRFDTVWAALPALTEAQLGVVLERWQATVPK